MFNVITHKNNSFRYLIIFNGKWSKNCSSKTMCRKNECSESILSGVKISYGEKFSHRSGNRRIIHGYNSNVYQKRKSWRTNSTEVWRIVSLPNRIFYRKWTQCNCVGCIWVYERAAMCFLIFYFYLYFSLFHSRKLTLSLPFKWTDVLTNCPKEKPKSVWDVQATVYVCVYVYMWIRIACAQDINSKYATHRNAFIPLVCKWIRTLSSVRLKHTHAHGTRLLQLYHKILLVLFSSSLLYSTLLNGVFMFCVRLLIL